MAKNYSRRTFLRLTPNALVREYFRRNDIELAIAWDDLAETDADAIAEAMDALDDAVLRRVDSDFSLVMQLACGKGAEAILEEASLWNLDWSEQLAAMRNDYERAMWTFLNEPRRFEAAGAFHEMDRYTFNWNRFVGYRLEARTDVEALNELADALATHYRRQGLGRHCHVDVYRRVEPERLCYFAYPEDAANTDLGYDENGRFQRRPRQSAFEVIFIYRPEAGTIELHARGNKDQKMKLAEFFCIHALGLVGLPDEDGRVPFDLSVLKDPSFEFPLDPADRVQSVDVRLLRLDLPVDRERGSTRRITLEAKSTQYAPRALYRMMSEAINSLHVDIADVQVGRAKLCFTFMPVGTERPKTLTFEVGYPDRCTLKDDPHDQIARKCLTESGIARNESAAVAVTAA